MTHVLQPEMVIHQRFKDIKIALIAGFIFLSGLTLGCLWIMFCVSPATQGVCGRILDLLAFSGIFPLLIFSVIEDYAKNVLGKAFFLLLFATAIAMFVLLFVLAPYRSCIPLEIATLSFRLLVLFFIVFFGVMTGGCIYSLILARHTPALVLNSTGAWTPYFGLIPWSNIVEVGPPSPTTICINIRVVDSGVLRDQAMWLGKFYLFQLELYKKLGYMAHYHISITYVDKPNDAIIAFARQYMHGNPQN